MSFHSIKKLTLLMFFLVVFLRGTAQVNPKEVEIIRDSWGVPHIYSATDAGVAYGLAWAHAEDDFETIQLTLLAGKQLLGQYIGKEGAAVDYVVSLMRLDGIARQQYADFSPSFKNVLHGYRDGINAFAKKNPHRVLLKRAFPVSEIDIVRAYGLSLSVFSGADRVISRIFAGQIGKEYDDATKGSNAFAVSRKKTTDDHVFIAINSHQPLEGPEAWYEAHLVSEEGWNMLGGLFPGAPVVFHGTNENIGWAHTVNFPDKVDIFKLDIKSEDPYQYKLDGKWVKLEVEKVKLKVKVFLGINISVKREVLWSEFGPALKTDDGVYAFHLGTLDDLKAIEQWYRMNKAKDFDEFREALKMVSIPGFNIVYADRHDNIYHLGNGKLPMRKPGYNWEGVIKVNSSEFKHVKYHTLDDLPQNLNPKSGFVFNTNNSVFGSSSPGNNPDSLDYPAEMGFDYWENNRSARFLELMGEYEQLFYDDFKRIKYDLQLPDSLRYPIDLNDLFRMSYKGLSDKARTILSYIKSWDKKASVDALGPAHVTVLYDLLVKRFKTPYKEYFKPDKGEIIIALEETYDYFMDHFGRTNIRLGEFQVLVRGDKEYPVWGMNDVIAAMNSSPYKNGKYRVHSGESYIMMVRYPREGLPIIETINVFGASSQPESKHYDDQLELFLKQELKPMTLDINIIRENAESVYHPE